MTTVTIELPEKVLSAMRVNVDDLANEMRLAFAVLWYEQGKISQEIAAKVAGLNRTDFLLTLARLGQNSFVVDFRDLDKELARG